MPGERPLFGAARQVLLAMHQQAGETITRSDLKTRTPLHEAAFVAALRRHAEDHAPRPERRGLGTIGLLSALLSAGLLASGWTWLLPLHMLICRTAETARFTLVTLRAGHAGPGSLFLASQGHCLSRLLTDDIPTSAEEAFAYQWQVRVMDLRNTEMRRKQRTETLPGMTAGRSTGLVLAVLAASGAFSP